MMNTNRRSFLASLAAAGLVAGHTSLHGQANPQRRYLKLPVEVVADRSIPTGQYKHPAAITELANGDLLLAWYGGDGEYAANTGVYAVRLPATARNHINGRNWSRPELIAQDPFRSVGNPVVWQAPASSSTPGWVWLFYVVRFGDTWSESHIAAKISKDGARTWSDASLISLDKGTLVRGKPIVLSNGETLLPIYREAGADREFVGDDTVSLFLRYQPEQKTWALSGPIRSRLGNLQPAPAEIAPGHLIAFCRRGGGYEARPDGWMVYAESHDFGRSWSEGRDLSPHFPNPNAAVDLLHLQNGHLLLVYNHSHGSRSPLSLALSEDNGKNWKTGLDVAGGRNDYAYPYLIQARDERIHLIYTSERRTQVNRMVFTEADIASTFPHSVNLR